MPNSETNNVLAILGTGGISCFYENGPETALKKAGLNLGNLLFHSAPLRHIRNPFFLTDLSIDPKEVHDAADTLMIPAANQINPGWDLSAWANYIENVDLPVVVVGLGAQAPLDSSTDLSLQSGTRRFLDLISERTHKIGVRGVYTAEVLARQGITNTEITGCPSNFLNPNVDGIQIEHAFSQIASTERSLNLCHVFGTMEPETRKAEKKLCDISRACHSKTVYQTNHSIINTCYYRSASGAAENYLDWERSILCPQATLEEYISYIIQNGLIFSSATAWIDSMHEFDLVYGMRIHGNIAAIQAGVPGICVAFDSRTSELVETMMYPKLRVSQVDDNNFRNFWDLVEKTTFSASKFDKARSTLWERYRELLRGAGLKVSNLAFEANQG